jgi:RNA recognition motif-containing protein
VDSSWKANLPDVALFVHGIPTTMPPYEITEIFSRFGPVESVDIVHDPITQASLGAAWVTFQVRDGDLKTWKQSNHAAKKAERYAKEMRLIPNKQISVVSDNFGMLSPN